MSFGTLAISYPDRYQTSVDVQRPTVRIGTAFENDVVLYDAAVAAVHVQIFCDASGYQLLDLGSPAGTMIAGQRVKPQVPVELQPYLPIQLGGVTLVMLPPGDNAPPVPTEPDAFGTLVVHYRSGTEEQFSLVKPLTRIGTGYANDIVLYDGSVSPYHAHLRCGVDGCQIVDLGSGTGTTVASQRLKPLELAGLLAGETAQLGTVAVTWQPATVAAAPVRSRRRRLLVGGATVLSMAVLTAAGTVLHPWRTVPAPPPAVVQATPLVLPTPTVMPTVPIASSTIIQPSPTAGSTVPSAAPTPQIYIVDLAPTQRLNVRSTPGMNASVIAMLAPGTTVQITGEPVVVDARTWVHVEGGGVNGWSARDGLRPR